MSSERTNAADARKVGIRETFIITLGITIGMHLTLGIPLQTVIGIVAGYIVLFWKYARQERSYITKGVIGTKITYQIHYRTEAQEDAVLICRHTYDQIVRASFMEATFGFIWNAAFATFAVYAAWWFLATVP